MNRRARHGLLFLVAFGPACFNPGQPVDDLSPERDADEEAESEGEGEEPGESSGAGAEMEPSEDEPVCSDLGAACEVNGDCCAFDAAFLPGDALCLDNGVSSKCAAVCYTHDECASGCCGGLEGITSHGACSDPAVCEAGYGQPSCAEGIELFCACAESVDVPCTPEAWDAFADACNEPGENRDVFVCAATYADAGLAGCGAMVDECLPDDAGD